ncbi:lactococcin 972 family bacteriocin [Glycomyces sp. L485]|uniref:lactococcin 972 family bacteriocin n=1 Tax=Glycomyces sp. L485 TaxID=2909235 RepID=UPI001F4A6E3C|nr:lactococcin 972 family bacteriocin [Glycomyces sp. L485]MCH7230613.1 lactococcin 972 family bacteriocin [Glycomyces sp. L485]
MTLVRRVITATVMAAALLGASAGAASAEDIGGAVQEGGVSIAACENVGGGTWCHGTQPDGVLKNCYSNYTHNSNYHSSTAAMAGGVSKRFASAGYTSRADVTAGWAYTCYTYYNPNA